MSFALTRRAALAGAAASGLLAAVPASAAVVTLIVPYPPGGAVDMLGRLIAETIEPKLGTIVVENRGGAGGSIGTSALARSEPDGATLGLLNVTQLIANKYLYAKLPYDPDGDLTPITRIATGTILCVANADVARERGWTTFQDLIAWAKKYPDGVRMGSSGVGTISHLGIELIKRKTEAAILHVPYKGGGPAIVDLLGGQIDMMFDVVPALAPHVREGKLVALAVGSRERIAALPHTPSMKEFSDLGLGEVDIQTWYALAGPKGLPDDKRDAVFAAVREVMAAPDVRAKLEPAGFSPVTDTSPDALRKLIADENPYWKELVRISGARLD